MAIRSHEKLIHLFDDGKGVQAGVGRFQRSAVMALFRCDRNRLDMSTVDRRLGDPARHP